MLSWKEFGNTDRNIWKIVFIVNNDRFNHTRSQAVAVWRADWFEVGGRGAEQSD